MISRRFLFMATCGLLVQGLFAFSAVAQLKVATLHPLLSDLARQVGGNSVKVIDLMPPGSDVHHFEPSPGDLKSLKGTRLLLASGKGMESYLDKLRDTLGSEVKIVEVGRTIPSIKITPGSEVFYCCPEHAAGGIDPHWWHSCDAMKRAARVIAEEFSNADPARKGVYAANVAATEKKIAGLKLWAQQQISLIPRGDRKLVTAHAAFSYFCKEFGFKMIPVLGLNREDSASPKYISEAVRTIKENGIKAIFPEDQANPKVLAEITRSTGATISKKELIADGTAPGAGSTFEGMMRNNVTAIVNALRPDAPIKP